MKTRLVLALGILVPLLAASCTLPAGKKHPRPLDKGYTTPERTPIYRQGTWTIARASLHNHTIFSDGCRTPKDLVEQARIEGMAVLSFNDHREGRDCVGKSQLFCQNSGGVEGDPGGYEGYYRELAKVSELADGYGMIVLRGVEVKPYTFNKGKFPALVIDGPQHHFTVYGIDDPEVLENMPTKNWFAFKEEPDLGAEPYSEFVDYINAHGGMVNAAHIEEGNDDWVGPMHGQAPPPVDIIHQLQNLNAFAILPAGWHERTAGPGGWWDVDLLEYLYGMRERPLWGVGDADYHCGGSLAIATTLLYMREFTRDEVFACMREGRMAALMGDAFQDVYVSEWNVSDSGRPQDAVMLGQEVTLSGAPAVRFALDREVAGCRTRLVRNGVVLYETEGTELTFRDEELAKSKEPAFYRVEVSGPRQDPETYDGPTMPESELFVNPIFVRFD